MTRYFGTDGIRGTYGEPPICPEFIYRLGNALGCFLRRSEPERPLNVILGRDTRESGLILRDALVCGLNQHFIHVHDGGIVPTPAVARSVLEQQADLGIVISASHNPAGDNGIKLFDAAGSKLSPEQEAEIEALIDREVAVPPSWQNPKFYELDVAGFYTDYLRSLMDQHCLKKWRVVLDTANGATCQTSPRAFERWSAELHLLGHRPDRGLINDGVGSEYPEKLASKVLEKGADIGIAHDGDGDRVVVCDETGQILHGDVLLGLLAMHAMRSGRLGAETLVATIHSNLGLDRSLATVGAKVDRTDVGDRNVARRMKEIGANLGGESSGHIIFADWATTGDGLLAAAKLIELMNETGKYLSELSQEIQLFPQLTKNLKVAEKPDLETLKHLQQAKRNIEGAMGDDGRVLLRYSGTEPKLRFLVEGSRTDSLKGWMLELARAAAKDLTLIDC
jgi:phosphoglucosamine mutase